MFNKKLKAELLAEKHKSFEYLTIIAKLELEIYELKKKQPKRKKKAADSE
jgi:hypothetical protein